MNTFINFYQVYFLNEFYNLYTVKLFMYKIYILFNFTDKPN